MRREIPRLLTFAFGLFIVLSNFIKWEQWRTAAESVNNWALIVIAFTYILGVGNLLRSHTLKISRRSEGWAYSMTTVAGLIVMVLFGMVLWLLPQATGGTVVGFRALQSVDRTTAVTVSTPPGTADLFDLRTETTIVKDANNDGSVQEGDEIDCRIAYAYFGGQEMPSAVFPIAYEPAALVPLGPGGDPLPPAPTAPGPDTGGEAPRTSQLAVSATGLSWDAGRIPASTFGVVGAGNGQASVFNWFYEAVYTPMQSTMFALLAFFISSAAFRAFRVRSTHAVLLGVTAIIVILGSVPVGEAVWSGFPGIVGWVMNCLQTAGKRAILIGAALGAIATGMKIVLGTEKSYQSAD